MPLQLLYISIIRTMTVCAIALFLAPSSYGQDSHPMDYIRSTRPLKSGGSITSHTSQGQKRSWVNQPSDVSKNAMARRETGFNQNFSKSSTSFYRQAQSVGTDAAAYPYPGAASPPTANARTNAGSGFASDQQAELRFERVGVRDRTTGDLGNTESANSAARMPAAQAPAARVAQLRGGLPAQAATGSAVNRGMATAPCNCGPNYADPTRNFAGYQGYQSGAVAANSVPALNTRAPAARVAQNCCVACQTQPPAYQPYGINPQAAAVSNPGYQVPQIPGYQFQPNIGVPQFGGTGAGGSMLSTLLTGSGKYTPLLQFRNMPPGSYLGQGLIGQPTAYVDGQPFRNLLRYIAP